jgi:hypothetical protein
MASTTAGGSAVVVVVAPLVDDPATYASATAETTFGTTSPDFAAASCAILITYTTTPNHEGIRIQYTFNEIIA